MCYIACAGPIIASPHACGDHAGGLRQPPICRHAPKTFSQSLVHLSYTHVHLSYARSCVCHPFNRRQKASSAACARPAATTPAAFASHPSAVMHRKLFAQSLVNSHGTLVYLSYMRSCLSPPSTTAKRPPALSVCRHHARPSPAAESAVLRPRFPAQSLVHLSETLVHLSCSVPACATPFNRRQKASSAACARPPRPRRRPSPASRLPSLRPRFPAQSLVHLSYTHVHLSYERSCLYHPFNRRQRASSAARARPLPRRRRPSPAAHNTWRRRPRSFTGTGKWPATWPSDCRCGRRYCYQRDCISIRTPSETQFTGKKK